MRRGRYDGRDLTGYEVRRSLAAACTNFSGYPLFVKTHVGSLQDALRSAAANAVDLVPSTEILLSKRDRHAGLRGGGAARRRLRDHGAAVAPRSRIR